MVIWTRVVATEVRRCDCILDIFRVKMWSTREKLSIKASFFPLNNQNGERLQVEQVWVEYQELSLGHAKFEMSVRNQFGDRILELKGEVQARVMAVKTDGM